MEQEEEEWFPFSLSHLRRGRSSVVFSCASRRWKMNRCRHGDDVSSFLCHHQRTSRHDDDVACGPSFSDSAPLNEIDDCACDSAPRHRSRRCIYESVWYVWRSDGHVTYVCYENDVRPNNQNQCDTDVIFVLSLILI